MDSSKFMIWRIFTKEILYNNNIFLTFWFGSSIVHTKTTMWIVFFSGEGSSTFLNFVRGDLILLDDDTSGEAVLTSGWCTGTCERTEDRGDFPAEAVYVLPCLSRPPDDILVSY